MVDLATKNVFELHQKFSEELAVETKKLQNASKGAGQKMKILKEKLLLNEKLMADLDGLDYNESGYFEKLVKIQMKNAGPVAKIKEAEAKVLKVIEGG